MSKTLRTRAVEAALDIACELRAPTVVTGPLSERAAHTLCYGLAGTALLHACLTDAEPGSAATAATHWKAAGRLLGTAPPDGIHTGPGAIAASLIIGTGYLPSHDLHQVLLPRATTWLSARAAALARHHYRCADVQQATPWGVYDAIKGLAGIGRVLLTAHARGLRDEAEPGLHAALDALTHMILTPLGRRPGWWLPADLHPPTVHVPATGAATTGLAHGIAGPLALLANARQAGHTLPGQQAAIRRAAEWLLTWQTPEHTWPPHISGSALDNPTPDTRSAAGRTTAWCYGTPGIAITLANAGHALDEQHFHHAAGKAMDALAAKRTNEWDSEGAALCHGSSGILQVAYRFPRHRLTERAVEHTLANTTAPGPGFLTGRAGTALALAEYAGLIPAVPFGAWDSLLLLS